MLADGYLSELRRLVTDHPESFRPEQWAGWDDTCPSAMFACWALTLAMIEDPMVVIDSVSRHVQSDEAVAWVLELAVVLAKGIRANQAVARQTAMDCGAPNDVCSDDDHVSGFVSPGGPLTLIGHQGEGRALTRPILGRASSFAHPSQG